MTNSNFTPAWEDVETWEAGGTTPASELAMRTLAIQREAMADMGPDGLSCITYDEDRAERVLEAQNLPLDDFFVSETPGGVAEILKDTDAFARQGDKGPYHWSQGPLDLTVITTPVPAPTPPVTPSPNPQPTKPGALPKKGKAVTTTNLRLRSAASTESRALGVMQTGTEVLLTGGRRKMGGALWVRVEVSSAQLTEKSLRAPDKWLQAPPTQRGWVNAEYLAVPASEYIAEDFPPLTHEYLWWLRMRGHTMQKLSGAPLLRLAMIRVGRYVLALTFGKLETPRRPMFYFDSWRIPVGERRDATTSDPEKKPE